MELGSSSALNVNRAWRCGQIVRRKFEWTIAVLNNLLQDRNTDVWPRIDMIKDCPKELKDMVKRQVVGV